MKRGLRLTTIGIVATTVMGAVVATSAQRAGDQRWAATPLLPCEVNQVVTMSVTIDKRGRVIETIVQKRSTAAWRWRSSSEKTARWDPLEAAREAPTPSA